MSTTIYADHIDEIIKYELARIIELDKQFQFKNRKVAESAKILLEYYSNLGFELSQKLKNEKR